MKKDKGSLKFITLGSSYDEKDLVFSSDDLNITVRAGDMKSVWHYHTFFEIEILLRGKAEVAVDNTELKLNVGDCVFCMPGSVQKIDFYCGAVVLTMRFREGVVSRKFAELLNDKSFVTTTLGEENTEKLCAALDAAAAAQDGSEASFFMFKGLVQFAAALIIMKADKKECSQNSPETKTIDQTVLSAVMHTRLNIEKDLTVKSLAEHLGYTPNYFSTLFKKETGKNYTEFLKEERLRLADILLENTNMPIYEIAKQTGFESSAYFCRVYKNTYGLSPNKNRTQ